MRLTTLSLCISLLLTSSACADNEIWPNPSKMEMAHLLSNDGTRASELEGYWRSEGYGWLLVIIGDDVELFDVTESACINAEDTLVEYETYFHSFAIDQSNSRLALRGAFEDYTYFFERISAKPPVCELEAPNTPSSNFQVFADSMSDHYAFFDVRGADWAEIVEQNRPLITDDLTDEELWSVFTGMVRNIEDGHLTVSRLRNGQRQTFMPGRGRTQNSIIPLAASRNTTPGKLFGSWYDDYKSSILKDLLADKGSIIARDRVIYGMLNEDIGYLNVLKMGGYAEGLGWSLEDFQVEADTLNAALDEALTHMATARAIVIDATYNGGGFDYLGREITARFTETPVLGSHRSPANTPSVLPQPLYTYPTEHVSFKGPVVVLTSNLTMSASESFVMHMKAMPHVVQIGEPTRGALSEVLSKTLPNGWSVSISNEDYLDGDFRSWEGQGVPPDVYFEVFNPSNMFEGHIEAVRYSEAFLTQKLNSSIEPGEQ